MDPFFNDPFFRHFFGDPRQFKPRERKERSLGSGVIISSDGLIMTNNHVIQGALEIWVVLNDGRTLKAKIVGTDPDTDLALLSTGEKNLEAIKAGNSETMQVGDVVV